jgi:hypothetical protein
MTIVAALSNSCILKAHHHHTTGHRRMTLAWLEMDSILKVILTLPRRMKKQMVIG